MNFNSQTTVREIAQQHPQAARIFESFGIDYCCGGKRPLAEACQHANVAVDGVMAELQRPAPSAELDDRWAFAPLAELANHIVEKHHGFVRQESPRLTALLEKVRTRHGELHPELREIQGLFEGLTSELASHMLKEEHVLFPMIQQLEETSRNAGPDAATQFRSIEFPIARMVAEHEDAGEALRGIRSLTGEYQPPAGACASFQALYQGLAQFERDLHQHIHLENNILFPRAVALTEAGQTLQNVV
ncbi:MAG TPA: iron-sulfur cluster repair di-iron protein [Bryobacteraceae bacterium]|nr:iron-sulfur cluster repair di-iron protein [Bryobacteraceae bacterium]